MLHKKLEPKNRTFTAAERRDLNDRAEEIGRAKELEETSQSLRVEARASMIDTMNVISAPANVVYHVSDGPEKGKTLCLDLGVRYEADVVLLQDVLGERMALVTKTQPVFDRVKAESALKLGLISEAELARCVRAVPRPTAQLRSGEMAPKGIEPGKGRVTPLKFAKGVKLDWG